MPQARLHQQAAALGRTQASSTQQRQTARPMRRWPKTATDVSCSDSELGLEPDAAASSCLPFAAHRVCVCDTDSPFFPPHVVVVVVIVRSFFAVVHRVCCDESTAVAVATMMLLAFCRGDSLLLRVRVGTNCNCQRNN
jgi:hypothetical protein